MGLPNCLRSRANFTPSSRQYFAPATEPTPSFQRPMLRMLNAILCPCPIVPSTESIGMVQSSRNSGQVELPRMPSLCSSGPTVNPGALRSIRKAVNCSPSTLANTVNRSAKPALVMNSFDPVSFQLLPSADLTALVSVSYTHLRAHETPEHLVCRLL